MTILKIARSCLKNSLLTPTLAPTLFDPLVLAGEGWKRGWWARKVDCLVGWMRTFETLPPDGTRSSLEPLGSLKREEPELTHSACGSTEGYELAIQVTLSEFELRCGQLLSIICAQ